MNKNKIKILVIDDEKGLRLGTKRLLESEGYFVELAENGTEGIAKGTKTEYDLVIIDLKMPDFDGLEVLEKIKTSFPYTICFIATAFASYETAIEATKLGAYSYIPKPFTPEELIHNLNKGFSQRQLLLESERLKKEREEKLFELASEKSRLDAIIKSIPSGVMVINKDYELVYFNNSSLTKLELDNINLGQKIIDKLPKKISEIIENIRFPKKETGKSFSTEIEIETSNKLTIQAVCSPVWHPDKSFAGVVIVLRDITEMKQIELIKSQFVSMVAHELKTPVSAVLGFLQLILDQNLSVSYEKQTEFLSRSVIRLKGLLDLVNDLLDISRMELKTKQREIEKLDIKEILESTLQFLEIEIRKKGLVLEKEFKTENAFVQADRNEITRLFTNILSNAIKYNKDKGKITVKIDSTTNYLLVSINDTGIGMKPEEKERLFNEFYRAKNEKTRNISGTGLGLSIVKRIVESYHGKIYVESEFEVGTTFTINLPINQIN